MKTCSRCSKTLPLSEFNKLSASPDGLQRWCRTCAKAAKEEWTLRRKPEFVLRRLREKDHAAQTARRREATRRWRERNPERWKAMHRAWKAANPERVRQLRAAYWQKHQDSERAYSRQWNRQHPESHRAVARSQRGIRRGAPGRYSARQWLDLKARYGYRCLACDRIEPEIKLTADHVQPIAKGGTNYIDNIQPLCLECNMRKRTEHIDYRLKHAATPIPLAVAS